MDGYQPPLLSLQDMLNLSENEDNNDAWSSSAFNISNFFEPIASTGPSKSEGVRNNSGTAKPGTQAPSGSGHSYSSEFQSVFSCNPFDDIEVVAQSDVSANQVSTHIGYQTDANSANVGDDASSEKCIRIGNSSNNVNEQCAKDDGNDSFLDLEFFEEAAVSSVIKEQQVKERNSSQESNLKEKPEGRNVEVSPRAPLTKDAAKTASSPLKNYPSQSNFAAMKMKKIPYSCTQAPSPPPPTSPCKIPTLKEVKVEDFTKKEREEKLKYELKNKCRKRAIEQLTVLINTLKRYSKQLEDFLVNEGNMILQQYNAKTLLSGILPEINESVNKIHPFYEAHSITQALVDHVKGRTFLSTLPRRKPFLWRGSDLLLLQKSILESVIHHREFLLKCRYTDLLFQMGFDSEDLEKLGQCITKEEELCKVKIIVNEHDFYGKLETSLKKPIQTVLLRKDSSDSVVPQVYVFPSPEKLVEDKWNALLEIRRRTTISSVEEKDIDWLYVMKKMTNKTTRLNDVDEEDCKLIYHHLLSLKYNNSQWSRTEIQKLQEIRKTQPNSSWSKVAEILGTNRSPFLCYVKHRLHTPPSDNRNMLTLRPEVRKEIGDLFEQCMGKASKVDLVLSRVIKRRYSWINPTRLMTIYQDSLNPRIRKGKFSLTEDALLLVVMEKYKDFMLDDITHKADPVGYALPWRRGFRWRQRLALLVTHIYTKMWTLEEDQRLQEAVQQYGNNFKRIQREFPFRDRKQCRNRLKVLNKIFKTTQLEDYHLYYSSRKAGLKIDNLHDVAEYLKMTIRSKLFGSTKHVREADLEFLKLRRKPTESELELYLMTFPVKFMKGALKRLTDCIKHIKAKWKEVVDKDAEMARKTMMPENFKAFDRRKFDPSCPISVASALHLRHAVLFPREMITRMTNFEASVYSAYKFFSAKSLAKKKGADKRPIPTLDTLRKLPSICRIIQPPIMKDKSCPPSFIVKVQSELLDEFEMDKLSQEVLHEYETKKKGGKAKGTKRKRTLMKERKKHAAMLRWQNRKMPSAQDNDTQSKTTSEEKPNNAQHYDNTETHFSEVPSPSAPDTPASTDSDLVTGSGTSVRKAVIGLLSDHSYIRSSGNLGDLTGTPLPQLFAIMSGLHGRSAGSENK